jgi:glycosyltransferase involved in cell wall biosynthesis
MSYIIFGDLFTFPEGDASTNRVHSYSKGFIENGKKIHVICFGNVYTQYIDGEINGVRYYHPYRQIKRSRYFVVRTYRKILKYIRTMRLFIKLNREEKVEAIIVYSDLPGTFLFAWLLSAMIGSVLLQEISEHPLRYYEKNKFLKRVGVLKVKTESSLTDGILCISNFLMDFYRKREFPIHKLLLVPSTVDPSRFSPNLENPLPFLYIGYFGNLTFNRDNVDVLIEAFSIIAPKHPDIKLVMGGPGTNADRENIRKLASELGISNKLILLDYLPREEIIKYIFNSRILVMVRANDIKSQASFPSKLTEYLTTCKPVISVNVGEVSMYLTDGLNAYIVEPGNKQKLAEKIDNVLSDYDSALNVAKMGKRLTETVFNYNYQAKRIVPFVDSLSKA